MSCGPVRIAGMDGYGPALADQLSTTIAEGIDRRIKADGGLRGPATCPKCGYDPTGDDYEFRSGGGWEHDTSVMDGVWIEEWRCPRPGCGEVVAREEETDSWGDDLRTDGGQRESLFTGIDHDTDGVVSRHDVCGLVDSVEPGTETVSMTIARSELLRALTYQATKHLHFVTNGETLAMVHEEPNEGSLSARLENWDHRSAITAELKPNPEHVATTIGRLTLATEFQSIPGDSDEITVHVESSAPIALEAEGGAALVVAPRLYDDGAVYDVEDAPDEDEQIILTDGGTDASDLLRSDPRINQDRPWTDAELMEELYHERRMSANQIRKLFDCSMTTVNEWVAKHPNCEKRSRSEAQRNIWGNTNKVPYRTHRRGHEVWRHSHKEEAHTIYVHRLQAVAEYGVDAVAGMHVHHKNGIKWDNRPENLELLTNSEHQQTHRKVSGVDRLRVAELYENGDVSYRKLHSLLDYGVTWNTIMDIHKSFYGGPGS